MKAGGRRDDSPRPHNGQVSDSTALQDHIRRYWDDDAATYDRAAGHAPHSPAQRGAWSEALHAALPAPPATVLDVGAGTGFLSLLLAGLGYQVSALDLSPGMLARLRDKADAAGHDITTIEGSAQVRPQGRYDAIVERHLLWTLPDPLRALAGWREAAPSGRLLAFEGLWGAADPLERWRRLGLELARRARRTPSDHHAHYDPSVAAALPLASATTPDRVVELVEAAGWRRVRLHRLSTVEWAERLALALPERLLGVTPRFAVMAE